MLHQLQLGPHLMRVPYKIDCTSQGSTLDANARECTRMHINAHAMHLKYHFFTTMHTAQVRCTIPINLSQKKTGVPFFSQFSQGIPLGK